MEYSAPPRSSGTGLCGRQVIVRIRQNSSVGPPGVGFGALRRKSARSGDFEASADDTAADDFRMPPAGQRGEPGARCRVRAIAVSVMSNMGAIMNKMSFGLLGLAGALVAACASAQVTFYEHEGFRGRSFTANGPIDNLAGTGFNDHASSLIVDRGEWQVCEHANFRGRCMLLKPGQYASLAAMDLDNRISSLRRVQGRPDYVYAPPPLPPPPPTYPYYPKHGEVLYTADVVAVRVVLGPPERRCWVETQQVATGGGPNVPGAIIGGVLGGVLGHQIGSGRGNDVATAIGAVTGAAVGANVNRGGGQVATQDVQRCSDVPGSAQPSYWDVTYVFRGVTHRAQLAFSPGPTITVNGRGEPRV
jgi:uncharacterized protein YcfJ